MDPNDWTPRVGWRIALVKSALRSAVIFLIAGALLYVAWPAAAFIPAHWAILAVVFLISAAVGYPMGIVLSRKLVEDSGLSGSSLLIPVLLILLAAHVGAFHTAAALRGEGGMFVLAISGGVGVWSVLAAAKALLTD